MWCSIFCDYLSNVYSIFNAELDMFNCYIYAILEEGKKGCAGNIREYKETNIAATLQQLKNATRVHRFCAFLLNWLSLNTDTKWPITSMNLRRKVTYLLHHVSREKTKKNAKLAKFSKKSHIPTIPYGNGIGSVPISYGIFLLRRAAGPRALPYFVHLRVITAITYSLLLLSGRFIIRLHFRRHFPMPPPSPPLIPIYGCHEMLILSVERK